MSKIRIYYNTYPDCPEATEYSKNASQGSYYMLTSSILGFGLSLLFLITGSAKNDLWLCIMGAIGCPILAAYTIFVRPKKIEKTINEILSRNKDK